MSDTSPLVKCNWCGELVLDYYGIVKHENGVPTGEPMQVLCIYCSGYGKHAFQW